MEIGRRAALVHGKRLLTVQKDGRIADMLIDAEVTQADLYYAGNSLIDKLHKTGEDIEDEDR